MLCSIALLMSSNFSLEDFRVIQSLELNCAQMPWGRETFTRGCLLDMGLPAGLQQIYSLSPGVAWLPQPGAWAEPLGLLFYMMHQTPAGVLLPNNSGHG